MPLINNEFSNAVELTNAFSQRICDILTLAIAEKGQASLLVSGGRTPVALFNRLSNTDIAWDKVVISLVDDRWVDINDDASNDRLVRAELLKNNAANATFIGLKHDVEDAEDAVALCESALEKVEMPFDVVILGMGEDGHTASLFPCSAQVEAGLDMNSGNKYIAVQPTTAPHQRMSLTLPAILAASNVFLHLVGEGKKVTIEKALQSTELAMPIKAVINRATVNLMWAPQ